MHTKYKFDVMNIDFNITMYVSMGCDSTDIDFINCTVINDLYIINFTSHNTGFSFCGWEVYFIHFVVNLWKYLYFFCGNLMRT